MRIFRTTRTLQRLDEMLTKAINGTFTEETYDETELSWLESDVFKICPSVQRVGSLVRQATEEILPRARQKEIQIEICGDIEGKANFDQKWTQEALYNILDNAVKYSPKGSRVEVEGISYEMYFCIAVKDQGIGIREEERAQIFSRFYRSDLVQQEEGIGIGLYLAREIVQREGGYIKVESKEGNGSIFKIFLQKE